MDRQLSKNNDFFVSRWDRTRSATNRLLLRLRQRIAFSRDGYAASVSHDQMLSWLETLPLADRRQARLLIQKFGVGEWCSFLNLDQIRASVSTLAICDQMNFSAELPQNFKALDAGTQDFARGPGLWRYLQRYNRKVALTGIEIDVFPPLSNFHSRRDIGVYIARKLPGASYVAADFFQWTQPARMVTAFFPFVSPHPALAWGLPLEYGKAEHWLLSIDRVLENDGLALVVHQGPWEEEEFDEARSRLPHSLELLKRRDLQGLHIHPQFPVHASIYRKV